MKTTTRMAAAALMVAGLAGSLTAQAQSHGTTPGKPYAEVGYAWLTLSSGGQDVSTEDLVARMGMDFMPYLGGEVFGATSASSGNVDGISFKVDDVYGAYLKLHDEITTDVELFARAGWVHSTLKASYGGYQASQSGDSFSYGVGLQFTFTDRWYMQGDYASYYDKHGDTINGLSLSLGYRF